MIIYLITCSLSMLFAWFFYRYRQRENKIQYALAVLISSLPCILTAGLRYGIGSDYFSYENNFLMGVSTKDPLYYAIFNSIIESLGGDFTTSVFVTALLTFLLSFARIFDDSPYPWLSIFLLFGMTFFFASMNAMRQFLALSILLYAIKALEQKQSIRFFVLVAIASGIHLSSIIFCVLYLLYKANLDSRLYVILTPIIFSTAYLLRNNISSLVFYFSTYNSYIEDNVTNGMSIMMQCSWQFALIAIGGVVYKNYLKSDNLMGDQHKFRIYLDTQLLAFWTYALTAVINPNEIMRILWVFTYPSIIFTPMVIRRLPSQIVRAATIVIIILGFSIFCYYVIAVNNSHQVLPYSSVFDIN